MGLAVAPYQAEMNDFPPLLAVDATRAELVTAIETQPATQNPLTTASTTGKETARGKMALATGQLGLKQAFTLSYAGVRYGEATEDVNHVHDLVKVVQALPAKVRADYRLTDAIIQAPADTADEFDAADDAKTGAKAAPRLATLALPELLRRPSAALRLMETLLKASAPTRTRHFIGPNYTPPLPKPTSAAAWPPNAVKWARSPRRKCSLI